MARLGGSYGNRTIANANGGNCDHSQHGSGHAASRRCISLAEYIIDDGAAVVRSTNL
jgi:hypothetical protein